MVIDNKVRVLITRQRQRLNQRRSSLLVRLGQEIQKKAPF